MSNKVSFEGIGDVSATFYAGEGVEVGQVVKLDGEAAVAPCAAGERFCGVVSFVKDGYAVVQVEGFTEAPCADSTVTPGWAVLTADGQGGVKAAGEGDEGREHLVVSGPAAGVITFKM